MELFKKDKIVKALDYSKPFVIVNFKTYKESTGENAIKLAKICEKVQEKTNLNVIVCCQAIDLRAVASEVKIPVYAQHSDPFDAGKATGNIIPAHLIDANIHGSLLNHSEKQIDVKYLEKHILKLKEFDLRSVVCAKDHKVAKEIASFEIKPDFIAVEPPELIGGDISVSTAKPEVIEESVNECKGLNVLVGAGVKDNNDMKIALKYGAKGVLLSSHVVLAKDPEAVLLELVKGIY